MLLKDRHRHVLYYKKALDLGLKPCVVIKLIKKTVPEEVHEKFDLMFELGAEEWQLDFPTVYGSAKITGCLTIGKT
jgi:GTP-binding protein